MNVAYLRVSTDEQELAAQRLAILEAANKEGWTVDVWVEASVSSRKSLEERRIDELLATVGEGDFVVVAELSRLGRSVGQIVRIVDDLVQRRVGLRALKQNIRIEDGKQDIQTKMQVTMFGLFAEIERDLISERTKEGLQAARSKGVKLGRPKGSLGKSKLDGKEEEIRELLDKKISKASIARLLGVSRNTLYAFISTRQIGG